MQKTINNKQGFIFTPKFFIGLVALFILGGVAAALPVEAISLMDGVSPGCKESGNCTVCDIMRVIYNVGRFIFMSMAGVALILLLWAAIGLIFNWGNAEMIAQNKKIIFHTFLAILIILAAYILVNMLLTVLSGGTLGADLKTWSQGPVCN